MRSIAEISAEYRDRTIRSLGLDQEDPRSLSTAVARADRLDETLSHMDELHPQQIRDLRNVGRAVEGKLGEKGEVVFAETGGQNGRVVFSASLDYLPIANITVLNPIRFFNARDTEEWTI